MKKELFSQLPPEVKRLLLKAREDSEKGGSKETSPAKLDVNLAETTPAVPAETTVPTAALGIMQAVTKTTSAAPELRNVLAAVRGSSSSGNRGEFCVSNDGKIYLSMNILWQYR